ncbi:MAG: hypothetical protein Q4C50_10665 [Eubacteriales bacterium]|nr:hypothetical protein [Eubacteriales bacterium]
MNLEKELKDYGKSIKIIPNEQKVTETIRKSMKVYCLAEQERSLTYWEFLWTQLRLIRKRWWLFQLLLLITVWAVLPTIKTEHFAQRILGVAASLFIILIIPELWKNKTCQSMEIEAASYYSLRQIYAARMLLFGIVDIVLITLFCTSAALAMDILLSQLLVQFLFPMTVTAAICFMVLCSSYPFSETTAMILCIAWSAIWLIVILSEKIYTAITFPLWLTFVGIAFAFLAFAVYRTLHACSNYWEVTVNEIDIR